MHLCISTEILNAREKERKCSGQTTYLLEVSQEGRGQRHVDNLSNDAQSSPVKIAAASLTESRSSGGASRPLATVSRISAEP